LDHARLEQALRGRRAVGPSSEHTPDPSHTRGACPAERRERGFDVADRCQPLAQRRFEGLLPSKVVEVSGQVDQRLEPVSAADGAQDNDTLFVQRAATKWAVVVFGHRIEAMKEAGEATACNTARSEYTGPRRIEGVRLVPTLGIDASIEPSPAARALAPAKRVACQTPTSRLFDSEQPSHPSAPAFDAPRWVRKPRFGTRSHPFGRTKRGGEATGKRLRRQMS
jgi:hypothetical protein